MDKLKFVLIWIRACQDLTPHYFLGNLYQLPCTLFWLYLQLKNISLYSNFFNWNIVIYNVLVSFIQPSNDVNDWYSEHIGVGLVRSLNLIQAQALLNVHFLFLRGSLGLCSDSWDGEWLSLWADYFLEHRSQSVLLWPLACLKVYTQNTTG